MGIEYYTGTSGYYYRDWFGIFYPKSIKNYKLIEYYSQFFDIVEINSSYYKIPSKNAVKQLKRQIPKNFKLFYKLYKGFTHQRKYDEAMVSAFKESLKILDEHLYGVVAQFPENFKYSKENLYYIEKLFHKFMDMGIFVVEFRHISWIRDDVLKYLSDIGITVSSVDEPSIPTLIPRKLFVTTSIVYIRFHSRDKENWYKGGGKRYDYFYSDEELSEWAMKIKEKKEKITKVFALFNNCKNGSAIKNAIRFVELLHKAL